MRITKVQLLGTIESLKKYCNVVFWGWTISHTLRILVTKITYPVDIPNRVVFFDGVCGLCNKTVDFLIDKVSFYVASATIKSTLYFGGNGILGKLYKHLDATPQFDEHDNLIKTFSFLDYVDIKIMGTDYRFVKVDINQKRFSSDQSSKIERDKFNKKMVMKKVDGLWKEVHDDFAKEYLESYAVLEKLNS